MDAEIAIAQRPRGSRIKPASTTTAFGRIALASPAGAALLLAGASIAMLQASLPSPAWLTAAMLLSVVLLWRARPLAVVAIPLLGFAWASLHGGWAMQARLPPDLVGHPLQLEGRIVGLPHAGERRVSFDFDVVESDGATAALAGRRLRLGWYGTPPVALEPGQHWQLTVSLKRPRGVLNPGGFDYERHALQRRIAATGHVRDGASNRLLAGTTSIDHWRMRLSAAIAEHVPGHGARFLQGLAVGDTRALGDRDWQVLRATGLSHLLAISGLHIGLLASFGVLLARALYWLRPSLALRLPRPLAAAGAALLLASGYSLLAGFGLPVQRALIMVAVALLAVLLRRSLRPLQALSIAAIAIVLLDPLAILGAGFWLSFVGVLWLLLCLRGGDSGFGASARSLLAAQWAMSIGLLPLSLWFFGQASLAGLLANLLAVPWVSLVVVPGCLLGVSLLAVWPDAGGALLQGSAWAMERLWSVAETIAGWPWAQLSTAEATLPALLLASLGVLWLLLPRPLPGKPLALLLLLPMLLPARERLADGEWELHLFDVGQGLAALVRTADHALLYDAGPAFDGGLDFGQAAVVPGLRALAIERLDRFVVSHGDNDHAGGAGAVRAAYAPPSLLSGEPKRAGGVPCVAGSSWQWSGVRFELLHPTAGFPELGNQSSCVLRIDGTGGSLLLPGDIDEVVEARLLRGAADRLPARVLVVPHHGSGSSSSPAFVDAVAAEIALIGVGHGNRFGHPRAEVIERYAGAGSRLIDTAASGAIRLRMHADGRITLGQRRQQQRRFWHEG